MSDDVMTLIKEIISPIAELLENQDEEYDGIDWEAGLPSRGPEGAISVEIAESQLVICIKELDDSIKIANSIYGQTDRWYNEWIKTIDIAKPGSLDTVRGVMEQIRDGYKPQHGVDGWEEV